MAFQVVSPAVSVYKELGVKDGQMQTEEHVIRRGELLPDWVSPHQQFVLSTTGMAVQVGDLPNPALRALEAEPAPVILPEHNPLAVVADRTVTQPMAVTRRVEEGTPVGTSAEEARVEGLPADADNKPTWERAAEGYGIPRAEAEAMRKADLVREVKARHSARERAKAEADADRDGENAK